MLTLNEDFLSHKATNFNMDSSLPLRLQKRKLLKSLGFPKDKSLKKCSAVNKHAIEVMFKSYAELKFPFLIIVSEKPSSTTIPPLFVVKGLNKITWRNNKGEQKEISYTEMLNAIKRFDFSTMLEFSSYIWGSETIAGRLLYISSREQVIELQRGVLPSRLITLNEFPLYSGSIGYLELQISNYRATALSLGAMGYQKILNFHTIKRAVEHLAGHFTAFEKLAKISPLPTLEFGILRNWRFIYVDVDWPSQWNNI